MNHDVTTIMHDVITIMSSNMVISSLLFVIFSVSISLFIHIMVGKLSYINFPISHWQSFVNSNNARYGMIIIVIIVIIIT
jgi:hypothetical protein